MDEKKKTFSEVLKCGHCGNSAPMGVVAHYSQIHEVRDSENSYAWDEGDVYQLLCCPACSKVSLRQCYYHEAFDNPEEIKFETLYPKSRAELLGLPTKVDSAYAAALKVRNIDVNAYGVLIGRVLDIVCEDRKAEGGTLNEKLEDLSKKGEIPIKLVAVAASLRQLRNVGAHADLGELTAAEAPLLDDLCRAILEYVYSAPHLVQKAEEKLFKLKKQKI